MSYGYVTKIIGGTKQNKITAGILDLDLFEGEELVIENLYPQANEVGLIGEESFDFKLINKTANDTNYVLKLQKVDISNELALTDVVYGLTKDNVSSTNLLSEIENEIIDTGTIKGNQTINYELRFWLREDVEDDTTTNNKTLKYKIEVEVSQKLTFNDLFKNKVDTTTIIDFTKISSATNGRGIYKYTEDGEEIYYWRGAVTDNHVVFAGFCWEAVRTTKTGGLKMIYDGLVGEDGSCTNTGTDSQLPNKSVFNTNHKSAAYSGYMYGNNVYNYSLYSSTSILSTTAGILYGNDIKWDGTKYTLQSTISSTGIWDTDYINIGDAHHYTCFDTDGSCDAIYYIFYIDSDYVYYITLTQGKMIEDAWTEMNMNEQSSTLKVNIDTWFEGTELSSKENLEKLEDTVFCNDRSVEDGNWGGWIKDGNATETPLYYSSHIRLGDNKLPSLNCNNVNDAFTVDESKGNGDLTYPVGLLTADETALAGAVYFVAGGDSYLRTGQNYWTLTPLKVETGATHFYSHSSYQLFSHYVHVQFFIRPVVSLSSAVLPTLTGTGTETDPYIVK